jgi:hypothetical protein
MKLQPNETELTGRWASENGGVNEDATCQRITWLLANVLKKAATDASGWEELYVDPTNGRYWELSYPQSELQGGGPPRLAVISEDAAKKKYNLR